MKNYTIKVSNTYDIPENIKNLTFEEWEIILTNLGELLSAHDTKITTQAETDVKQAIELKFTKQITALEKKLEAQITECTDLKDNHDKQIKKLRKDIELQYKNISSPIIESKDSIIANLTSQIKELQSTSELFYSSQVDPLKKQIAEMNNNLFEEKRKLLDIHEAKYDSQIKKVRDDARAEVQSLLDKINKLLNEKNEHTEKSRDEIIKIYEQHEIKRTADHKLIEEKYDLMFKNLREEREADRLKIINQTNELMKESCEENTKFIKNIDKTSKEREIENTKLRNQIDKIQKEKETAFEQYEIKREQDTSKLQLQLQTIREKHEIEMQKIRDEHSKDIAKLMKANILEVKGLIEKNNASIITSLDPLIKFHTGTNNEKGTTGEIAIKELLTSMYEESIVEDTSAQLAAGDVFFNWKGIRCLIEIKNKAKLTKDDIEKFIRDVNTQSENSTINCAVFLSLRTNNFPSRTREVMQLDYVNGIPTVYIYAPPPASEIRFAITLIDHLISNKSTNADTAELQQQFVNYFKEITDLRQYFDKELKEKQRDLKIIAKKFEHYDTLCKQLSPMYSRINITELKETLETQSETDEIPIIDESKITLSNDPSEHFEQFTNEYTRLAMKNQTPSATTLAKIFGTTILNIDLKKIITHATQLYLTKQITQAKITAINAFIDEHKTFPNRSEIVKSKIISDHTLRNIVRVSGNKSVIDVVQKYFDTFNAVAPVKKPSKSPSKSIIVRSKVKSTPTIDEPADYPTDSTPI